MSYRHLAPRTPLMDRKTTYWLAWSLMMLAVTFLAYAIGY